MKIYIVYFISILLVSSCMSRQIFKKKIMQIPLIHDIHHMNINNSIQKQSAIYDNYINRCAHNYGVDASLIKAIIKVESNYNPIVISKSNAVGLMQLKPDTAGKDVYRLKGLSGTPSVYELQDAAINIDFGAAYLSILQKQLKDIVDVRTRRYAIIVAYVNGLSALLQIFSFDHNCAIKKMNKLSSEQFYQYIQYYHPSKQAQRYLSKVNEYYLYFTM